MKPKKRILADGSRICRPKKYMSRRYDELPLTEDAYAVFVGLLECQAEAAKPEYSSALPRITGRYAGEKAALCVNQAGFHVQVWYSSVLDNKGSARVVYRYAGQLKKGTSTFHLKSKHGTGKLTFAADFAKTGRLKLEFDDKTKHDLVRFSKRATWSDRILAAWKHKGLSLHPVARGMLDAEHAPIVPKQIEALREVLLGKTITKHLAKLFTLDPDTEKNAIHGRLEQIRKFYEGAGYHEFASPFAKSDSDRIVAHAWRILHASKETFTSAKGAKAKLTRYEWFQRVHHYNHNYSSGSVTINLKTWFGVEPSAKYRYRVHMNAWGYQLTAGIPLASRITKKLDKLSEKLPDKLGGKFLRKWVIDKVGGLVSGSAGLTRLTGVLTIMSEQKAGWTETYGFDAALGAIGSGGGGLSVDMKVHADGWCETPIEWFPQDFPGDLNIFTGLLSTWDGKKATDQLVFNARGSGADKGTQIIFDKVTAGAGLEAVGIGWGEIVGEAADKVKPPKDRVRFKHVDYDASTADSADAGFVLGSATVTDAGRRKLRVLAANELAELRNTTSRVRIMGFADRIDRAWFNLALSSMRATNLETALKDCLGTDLKAAVKLEATGEDALKFLDHFFDFPDDKPNPNFRRAFAFLNSTASIRLKVRDLVPPSK